MAGEQILWAGRLILVVAVCMMESACTAPINELPPSLETLRILRDQDVPPMALGTFVPASKAIGRSIAIRLSVMHAPKGRNFAEFLGATFETELKAAGRLDPASPLRLEGVLTESHAGEDFKKGGGALGARISLIRNGRPVLAKDYRVDAKWHSDFIGALAIDEAFFQYNALYAQLVRKVLSDPEFISAAKR
ncbi:hypothetical protein [Aquisediminimonas profunda]|uniref:hypothetical protein n=1 Tax=Aquisediminimonas profunda TaxID=1550733 RepID=UPI001C6282A1|nr:hypothetical protein [Aquisediminimonas profunda]